MSNTTLYSIRHAKTLLQQEQAVVEQQLKQAEIQANQWRNFQRLGLKNKIVHVIKEKFFKKDE